MDIITLARELGKAIQQDEAYLAMQSASKANDDDLDLQKMLERFNILNTTYEYEAGKSEPDEKRCEELEGQLEQLYHQIMGNGSMSRFEEAKNKMDEIMNKVVAILAAAVNGEDPDTFDPDAALAEEESCGGDCDCCHHDCH